MDHYKQWRQDNKKHLNEYRLQLKICDPNFKVACSLRSRISTLIRKAKLVVIVTGVVVGGYVVYKYFMNKSE